MKETNWLASRNRPCLERERRWRFSTIPVRFWLDWREEEEEEEEGFKETHEGIFEKDEGVLYGGSSFAEEAVEVGF